MFGTFFWATRYIRHTFAGFVGEIAGQTVPVVVHLAVHDSPNNPSHLRPKQSSHFFWY